MADKYKSPWMKFDFFQRVQILEQLEAAEADGLSPITVAAHKIADLRDTPDGPMYMLYGSRCWWDEQCLVEPSAYVQEHIAAYPH